MGVKSTTTVTRAQAIERMVDQHMLRARQEFEFAYANFSNEQLERMLENLNDEEHGGEGFENYNVADED